MSVNKPMYSNASLQRLMDAYAAGIVEYWDGDQRVKYDSLNSMYKAIERIRREMNTGYKGKPMGNVKYNCNMGYQR